MVNSSMSSIPPLPASLWKHLTSRQLKGIGAAFERPEFRLFLGGSFLSNIGTWMQSVAQAWLVLQLTNSPFYLGLDGFANTLPIAIFAFWGGAIADRFDRRQMLILTQWIQLSLATILGILTYAKVVVVWEVLICSFCTGMTQSIAWPVYQTILANIAPREHLSNAIALNSTQFNLARIIGPVVGAFALSYFGTAGCFFANAISFLAVLYALYHIHIPTNRKSPEALEGGLIASIQGGFRYMVSEQWLLWFLVLLASSSIFGVPLMTLLPAFARDILKIGASGYGVLVAAFGIGAVFAGILVALLGDFPHKGHFVIVSVFLFVGAMLGFALSHNILMCFACLNLAGFSMVGFTSVINTLVQSKAPEHLRGRAMSLFVFSFGGCMPLGNLLAGSLAKVFSVPATLVILSSAMGLITLYIRLWHGEVGSIS